MRGVILVAVLLLAACQTPATAPVVEAAPTPAALRGDYFQLDSQALGRPLHIHVSLPEGYQAESATYPVVYITDGDSLFPLLAPTQLFLTYDEPVPKAILVGIAYGSFDPNAGNMRHVDFRTPGAEAYQHMLADELIPEIERRFRTDPTRRVLLGQSRGGSFVFYSAMRAPDMFWGRIVSNASFSQRDIFDAEPAAAARDDLRLFVASGSRDRADLRADALVWHEQWRDREKPWALRFVTIEDGTHAASIGEVYRQGMIWLFADE